MVWKTKRKSINNETFPLDNIVLQDSKNDISNDFNIETNNISENNSDSDFNSFVETTSSGRLKGIFVSPNVFNLSSRQLSQAEISLLSKGLKFVPTPTFVNRALIKEELEKFGRNLRLKWHFRNEESTGDFNPFRPKSKFNQKERMPQLKFI